MTKPLTKLGQQMANDPRQHVGNCAVTFCSCGQTQNIVLLEREAASRIARIIEVSLSAAPVQVVAYDMLPKDDAIKVIRKLAELDGLDLGRPIQRVNA